MTHTTATNPSTAAHDGGSPTTKRQKLANQSDHQPLLPGLPDHIAHLCLSLVHPFTLYSVSRSWRHLLYSPSFFPFLSFYALLLSTETTNQTQLLNSIEFFSFDLISSRWHSLPPPLPDPPLFPILRHHSFLSRNFPIQSLSVSGNLVLLAATASNFLPALPRPLIFNPLWQKWVFGPLLSMPRHWCATGASSDTVYVASGIGSQCSTKVARFVEKWDLRKNHHRNNNRSGRRREEIPDGMLVGWKGPATAMDEQTLYTVDESNVVLRKYDTDNDGWEKIMGVESLKGRDQITVAGGGVCVMCGGTGIVVVDVVASPARLWKFETPTGF